MTAQALFREAAAAVEAALARLDMRHRKCREPDCGHVHFTNEAHWKIYRQFEELPEKLRNAATKIERIG